MILLKSSSNNSPHTTNTLGGAYGCAVQLRSYKQILVPKCSHKKECCFKWLETNRFKEIQSVLLLLLLHKNHYKMQKCKFTPSFDVWPHYRLLASLYKCPRPFPLHSSPNQSITLAPSQTSRGHFYISSGVTSAV